MKVKELGEKCKEIEIDCDNCQYTEKCEKLSERLEDISPYGLISILEEDI